MEHSYYMHLALQQAQTARYITSPNPRVGCVIVKNHTVIAQGHTQQAGGNHAEIEALKQAQGMDLKGSTFYITLEPCTFFGKTPPCIEKVLQAKPSRVVIATLDPHPKVNGQGVAMLKAAGVDVEVGVLEAQAQALNAGFFKRMQRGLPWLRLKIAASLDGRTALFNGQSQWITAEAARLDGQKFRASACAVLSGAGTVKSDDPLLNVRNLGAINIVRQPKFVLIDSYLDTPLSAKVLKRAPALVFCGNATKERITQFQQTGGHEIIPIPETSSGKVDLKTMLLELGKREINEVHSEAGSKLNASLLQTQEVDELLIYYAPKLIGEGIPLINLPALNQLSEIKHHWRIVSHAMIGEDLRLQMEKY